ncbi:MAG: FAD-dependent oxidoreductase [Planctomycetota bacterium]
MRVLIAGGGVAGLTLAARLRQQGRHPVVVEKAHQYGDAGYGLGLYPLGSCVLHGLGMYQKMLERSVTLTRYDIADARGRVLQTMDTQVLTDHVGPLVMLSRTDLIDLLREACGELPIRMGTSVQHIDTGPDDKEARHEVQVTFSDGSRESFDLVVACDGIHSDLRERVFGKQPGTDTGWLLWTWWGRGEGVEPTTAYEFWGRGWLAAAYPVPGRCMMVVGMPRRAVPDATDSGAVRSAMQAAIGPSAGPDGSPVLRGLLDDAAGATLFPWPMIDVGSRSWVRGRVALCGDAGTAFLPTAGAGASNALRSAAALADELSRADAASVPLALEMYVKRCQRIVRRNQADSRFIARFMFVSSRWFTPVRDLLIRFYPARRVIAQIIASMRQPF